MKKIHWRREIMEPLVFVVSFLVLFGCLGHRMGLGNMLNTIMQTSYRLLVDTVLFLMAITVLTGALGKLMVEFGVVRVMEKILQPMMKPLYQLPGVAALGAVLTFLSDNPAIISLAKDSQFGSFFKKYQMVSLTNFGTAFGMGLIVVVFMSSQGFVGGALVGLIGAILGSIISTRLMQYFTLRSFPSYKYEPAFEAVAVSNSAPEGKKASIFIRALNAILDGGKTGVELGVAIIPGVLIISTVVMMLTFGSAGTDGQYTGVAYEGVPLLPYLAEKVNVVFEWLFGFSYPELISFPITAMGAVGAALGLVPELVARGLVDNNVIAVYTAIGMCWSGYLSTHTAMLDSLGYRHLIGKAIAAHTIGGLVAGISAHWIYVLIALI